MEKEINKIIEKINMLHPEDPKIYNLWEVLTNILIKDENTTIDFLNSCEDKETIDNLSSVFADVSIVLQSSQFINCIEKLEIKFPDLLLKHMIQAAKEVIFNC